MLEGRGGGWRAESWLQRGSSSTSVGGGPGRAAGLPDNGGGAVQGTKSSRDGWTMGWKALRDSFGGYRSDGGGGSLACQRRTPQAKSAGG